MNLHSIRKLATAGTLVFSFATFGFAQAATNDQAATTATQNEKSEKGDKGLGLSADQKAQIKQIRENTKQQIQAVKADNSLSKDQKKAKIKDLHESGKSQINALLTPEQQKKWAEKRASHRGMHKRHKKQSNG